MPVYTFRIQRNQKNAQGTLESRYQEYTLELNETTTVLNALEELKGNQDGTLTFRQSCRSAICGSCAMKISGRTRLACKTHVGSVARDGVIELAPMANQPVLKDLVIDIGPFFRKVHQIKPYLEEGPEKATTVERSSYDQVNHVTQCIMCGCCYSDCTMKEVSEEFIGPAALAKAFRFVSDPREGQKTARLQELSEPGMMWSCTRCAMCIDSCPKDVKPMEAIVKLRTRGMQKGFVDGPGPRHALAFHQDIQKWGDLNEFTLLQRTVGILGSIAELGTALHLLKKGKIPSPFPHQAQGVEQLQKIYKLLEQNPIDVETKAKEVVPE
ncbi:succinate dehydrogenase/fumarate reductase iron-sulfur subunit [Candidatus Magnetaquicoccus inordinatus]|uniref:succinate dehydrogenase/fumarate reductase iron-sulfur subunit n=1 Tax=Candidatus Magnetaquicoccus inordinatus TaxID=2496818 RepID=UPI00102AFC4D|nr:succinate dehydrogenase iron-sulfur subunit [Candidatus Magnetaquicoccus inordinatus]